MGFGGTGPNFRGGQGFTRSHLNLPGSGAQTSSPVKMDGRPDLNPYAPTSLAHGSWQRVRKEFDQHGREAALLAARDVDRNLALGLEKQVERWRK